MTSTLTPTRGAGLRKIVAATSASALAAGLMVGFGASTASADDPAGTQTFTEVGAGSFTVPAGVQTIFAEATGGAGAGGGYNGGSAGGDGGVGAWAKGSVNVANINVFNLKVGAGGVIGGEGIDSGGRGGAITTINENGGTVNFIAGGGGGGASGHHRLVALAGKGSAGGAGGGGSNGAGHDGSGAAGGGGGSNGTPGTGGTCSKCTNGDPGTTSTGGKGGAGASSDDADAGQGGFGGDGFGGGGGGGLPTSATPPTNGGGGAGGSRITGSAVVSGFSTITKADTGGGSGGTSGDAATAGANGKVKFTWLLRPTDLQVTPGDKSLTMKWTEPDQTGAVDSGFSEPTYDIYFDGVKQNVEEANPAGTTISNLTPGKVYAVTIVVSTKAASGTKYPLQSVSSTVKAGPAGGPDAPAAPKIGSWGVDKKTFDGWVNLSWSPPAHGGAAITDYHVEQQVVGTSIWAHSAGCATVPGNKTSCKVTNLVDDVEYIFRVNAENSVATSDWSKPSVKVSPHFVPPAPVAQVPLKNCVKIPKKIRLNGKYYPILAPNCKTNAGKAVSYKVKGKAKYKKLITYTVMKVPKGKYKGYMAIKTYKVKGKANIRVTWSAAAKARPFGEPTGKSYKAYSKVKSYKVRR